MSGPIFFAWVDGTETTFDPVDHAREDEDIYSITITHQEGQIPNLDVVIRFPEVGGVAAGLLGAGRKQWAWLSWRNRQGDIEPLFFGRILGFPENINDILVPIKFIARARNYVAQKQALADTLRVRPFYDPIFLDDKALEDPESILEGWSCAYHVDRIDLSWSVSDILIGDETIYFDESDIINGSVDIRSKGAPLRAVRMDATVQWKQNYRNTIIPVAVTGKMRSYNPGGLVSAWPKVGSSLGGGWVVAPLTNAVSFGGEPGRVDSGSGSWQDQKKDHNDGDAISSQWSWNIPIGGQIIESTESATYGNMGGSTDFLNTPPDSNGHIQIGTGDAASQQSSSSYTRQWKVAYSGYFYGTLYIQPDGSPNNFTEHLTLTVSADTQDLLTDPTSQEETEVIELNSRDIGEAILSYKCMTTLSGQAVQAGQIMLPNLAPGPSKYSYQMALNSGTAGVATTDEDAPVMSDVIGVVTAWGTIDWVCVGNTLPSIIDWEPQMFVQTGTILCTEAYGGWFFFADQEGFTGKDTPFWTVFGTPTPGLSTPGTRFTDNGVVWVALGFGGPSIHVPAQGQPGNIVANSFFDKDRGAAAIEYMIMIARNKIRTRARALEISFRTTFDAAVDLSCRKSASVNAPRLIPGGLATGKIIAYTLSWSGLTGDLYADVTIGCSIGKGTGDAAAVTGAPTVAELDALVSSAQVMDGAALMIGTEISYQPPPPDLTYNGLRYPLTRDQIVIFSGWVGSAQKQLEDLIRLVARPGGAAILGLGGAIKQAQYQNAATETEYKDPFYYEFQLRPISDQHTTTPYEVVVSKLLLPKQIDLEA